ncbi:MAG: putative peroxiredoxin [Methanosaeta sp. PtaB.Bin039]|nr:MAG: putative peroxiredoxin [Methanosaeta sp. PtaB.Bin039]OPY46231.1 MAG: putative peroxiredoxin [Methanosaeta sp. PtaU1.Bin028]HOT07085.1 thioredoxin-dependent thiol peroxidase [Methanotrichaceae archaeon]HQF17030.1 thioredoxin-dependent thiol peroxidase [Methanotrichaceae archaeon]HQI91650.1 thioredoxin-dependent thiol peroxidase [Methanotrichaceae archaeon]
MSASEQVQPEIGDLAPPFCLPDQDDHEVCLAALAGKWAVLYFYPKDNTSGCTQEAREFSSEVERFEQLGAAVLGISPDSSASHARFAAKHQLKLKLLSDPEHKALEAYGVWGQKKMYGREYYGVTRSTFLIDPEGRIAEIWRKVKVKDHAIAVQRRLKELRAGT